MDIGYLRFIRSKPCLLKVCPKNHFSTYLLDPMTDYSALPVCEIHRKELREGLDFNECYGIDVWKEAFGLVKTYFAR